MYSTAIHRETRLTGRTHKQESEKQQANKQTSKQTHIQGLPLIVLTGFLQSHKKLQG
jgi:hypothetical protein